MARLPSLSVEELAAAFGDGRVSNSKDRAITRVAEPDDGIDWVELARHRHVLPSVSGGVGHEDADGDGHPQDLHRHVDVGRSAHCGADPAAKVAQARAGVSPEDRVDSRWAGSTRRNDAATGGARMFVSELMTTPAVTVEASLSVKAAARLLRDRNIAAAPVVDDDGGLVGIVSELDLLRGTVLPDPVAHLFPVPPAVERPPATVLDVMSTEVQVLAPHSDLHDAARLMRTSGVRSLPVLEHGRVVGVVSRADLLRVLAREDSDIAADVRELLAQEFGAHSAGEVRVEDGIVHLTATGTEAEREAATLLAARVPGVVRVVTDP